MNRGPLKKPAGIPSVSGVYIFRDAKKRPLYIGKAANLNMRLRSYFQTNIPERILRLRAESRSLDVEETENEFDALVREAELIKKYRPKYNILLRDDKNYYYVVFTREVFPRILITHQPETRHTLGPFTEGRPLYAVMRLLRKIIPYCTCKKPHTGKCVAAHIGRCLGFCCEKDRTPTLSERAVYRAHIMAIKKILTGRSSELLREYRKAMQTFSKARRFEDAAQYRDRIQSLKYILSHKHIVSDRNPFILKQAKAAADLSAIFKSTEPISRIEGYDVAVISGSAATASLVVFQDGVPIKNDYKRFKIRTEKTTSDIDMMREVIARRLRHADWPLPDMMLIDGGMPQLRSAAKALNALFGKNWPIILAGISKARRQSGAVQRKASERELLHMWGGRTIPLGHIPQTAMHTLQRIRDEAHRFARSYHHLLRKKTFEY